MKNSPFEEDFTRKQASKSRFSGHVTYGYSHDQGVRAPRTNVIKNEYTTVYRGRRGTEWQPKGHLQHPQPFQTMCYMIYHTHVSLLPNYAGHVPGAQFRFGQTFGNDTLDAKRWLRGDQN